jgi:hypothetical protein
MDEPVEPGIYLEPGEGIWFKEGESVTNPKKSKKTLDRINDYFI